MHLQCIIFSGCNSSFKLHHLIFFLVRSQLVQRRHSPRGDSRPSPRPNPSTPSSGHSSSSATCQHQAIIATAAFKCASLDRRPSGHEGPHCCLRSGNPDCFRLPVATHTVENHTVATQAGSAPPGGRAVQQSGTWTFHISKLLCHTVAL